MKRRRVSESLRSGRAWVLALSMSVWFAVTISGVETSSNVSTTPGATIQPALRPRSWQASSPKSQAPEALASTAGIGAVFDKYCVTCHNDRLHTAGLSLQRLDLTNPSANADLWERVIAKLRLGSMPPAGSPRPDEATYRAVTGWLEKEIDTVAAASPNPGRSNAVHRLNRTEYRNAIRDLLALDIDVASMLPPDETSDTGFDNNADVLSITTTHLERYMSAARQITRLATGLPLTAGYQTYDVPLLLLQDDRVSEDLPLGSRGGIAVRHYFPADGEYSIKVRLRTNWQDYILGMGTPHQLDIRIDGERLTRLTVGGEAPGRPAPTTFTQVQLGDLDWEKYLQQADRGLEIRVPVQAGSRLVSVSFVRQMWEAEGIAQPRQAGEVLSNDEGYHDRAAVQSLSIGGPYQVTGSDETPSRREIFVCRPSAGEDEEKCARTILSRLARRAYRRPVTARDLQVLLGFFQAGRTTGSSFEAGIQLALERILIDPAFLLRIERDPTGVSPGQTYRLTDVEVASRLSFFMWSSIPDETLLQAAERGALTSPWALEEQVRRMLADPRAKALVDNFATQWLHLRNLESVVGDPIVFPGFDHNLIEAFRRETDLFIASTLSEDRSVLDLLRANYTFVNERLARHYGIPGIYGNRFRRVILHNTQQRGGLLAHGGLLALTSYPGRTSPVLRGKWLLDTMLAAPPPAPPPDVPTLPERDIRGKGLTVRQRLEQHRRSPACASCHAAIDPPGFALENFDALGAWRTVEDGGHLIDATGTMLSGDTVQGLSGLRTRLLNQPDRFAGTVTKKLLAYALGRGLEYYDQPTVRKIVRDAALVDYRWSSLILGTVQSPAFLMRRSRAPD